MQSFKNKVVVIIGASAGVGADTARQFARRGAKLVLLARGQAGLDKIAAELTPITEVMTVAMDAGSLADCEKLLENVNEKFGGLDVLVNNAALHYRGDVAESQAAQLASMVDVNLKAPIFLSTLAIPLMKKRGEGAIVMVASLAGRSPLKGEATYCATKAGLRSFAFSMGEELSGQNIHIGVVSPGPINTGFIMDDIDNVPDIVYSQPMSSPEEVAEAVLECIQQGKAEIALPKVSAFMSNIAYLSPKLRKISRPYLDKIGRKNKEKYRRA